MSEAGFTKGPWVVIPRGESSGHSVATIEPRPDTMERTNYWTVANVNGLRDEWESNLYLISAAPDLLEVARMCLFALDGGTGHADAETRRRHLHAAIAKAEGK